MRRTFACSIGVVRKRTRKPKKLGGTVSKFVTTVLYPTRLRTIGKNLPQVAMATGQVKDMIHQRMNFQS